VYDRASEGATCEDGIGLGEGEDGGEEEEREGGVELHLAGSGMK